MGLGSALHNDELTNSQLEAVARGFSATPRSDLAEPFAAKYFETVDWVWANKTYHMAELCSTACTRYADPATLVKLGDAWLDEHIAADNALKRLIVENVASSTAPSRFANTTKRSDFLLAPLGREGSCRLRRLRGVASARSYVHIPT